MKIQYRLTLIYALLMGVLFNFIGYELYINFEEYSEGEFYERLGDRALTTAKIYFEPSVNALRRTEELHKSFQRNRLTDEVFEIYDDSMRVIYTTDSAASPAFDTSLVRRTLQLGGLEYMAQNRQYYGMAYRVGPKKYAVMVSAYDKYGLSKLKKLKEYFYIGMAASIVVMLALGWLFARQALAPIGRLVKAVRQINADNISVRLPVGRYNDEIDELARAFNEVLRELEIGYTQRRRFVQMASHELRTPLTAMISNLEVQLSRPRTAQVYEQTLRTTLEDAYRMTELANGLLQLAQIEAEAANYNIEPETVENLLEKCRAHWTWEGAENIVVRNEASPGTRIKVKEGLLEVALNNLLANAVKYGAGKPVTLSIRRVGTDVHFDVKDKGIGIPDADLPCIFDPFYRAGNTTGIQGTGLGLALVKQIAKIHGGDVAVQRNPDGVGMRFTLILPAADEAPPILSLSGIAKTRGRASEKRNSG
ncbi:MAG: HAMP domain-containing sensor histidine kinase [Bacteroidia bacterium]|nr:ATP-binding protein [Bacteroidia bacterium]MDW8332937.1 HAMP domain-containing sensor histidine kinase [Bacteroidia bacterium]